MTFRLSLVVSLALGLAGGALAQDSADVTQCFREMCQAPESQVSGCGDELNKCLAANGDCDDLYLICENLANDCITSCRDDPFGARDLN